MKRLRSFRIMLIVSACIMLPRIISAQDQNTGNALREQNSSLDQFFQKVIADNNYVALGACLMDKNGITWEGAYGYRDLEAEDLLKTTDIFQLASLSKTVTTTALMQLYEKGLFNLDDDVNKYVPFNVRNPNFPDIPITIRMLLTHTNSFEDIMPMGNKVSLGVWGDSPIPFREFVEGLFTPGSKYYSADYFSKTVKPGTKYGYSNISFSLIGYLVEQLSGKDFEIYCNENIFKPMGVVNTSWHLKDLDTSRIAFGYGFPQSDTSKIYKKIKHFGTPGYPEGMLRTTMQDLSRFVVAYINKGTYKDFQMLKPGTVNEIVSPQGVANVPSRSHKPIDMGLTWVIFEMEGDTVYSMNGFSGSIFTAAYFSPKYKAGMIFYFTGITMKNMQGMLQISKTLYERIRSMNTRVSG